MATQLPINGDTNGHSVNGNGTASTGTFSSKAGLARMLKGGVIMDVVNAEQVRPRSSATLCHHMIQVSSIEWRSLYQKAVSQFIATNEMSFRGLLKEFHDHEMVVSRKDAMGTEVLSVPFRREELETLLEELVGET